MYFSFIQLSKMLFKWIASVPLMLSKSLGIVRRFSMRVQVLQSRICVFDVNVLRACLVIIMSYHCCILFENSSQKNVCICGTYECWFLCTKGCRMYLGQNISKQNISVTPKKKLITISANRHETSIVDTANINLESEILTKRMGIPYVVKDHCKKTL